MTPTSPLVPAAMLANVLYCPRAAYLEWVQRDSAESAAMLEGEFQHRRVDVKTGDLPEPDAIAEPIHARSVTVSDDTLGAIAVIDLIEGDGGSVIPVDYKRGAIPDRPGRSWESDRAQLCLQGLLLRARGYHCESGVIYYMASKARVPVDFDEILIATTKQALADVRLMAEATEPPPPLVDSPKCPPCSLVGLCLPDEVNLLSSRPRIDVTDVRRLTPARPDALSVHIQMQGVTVGKSGDTMTVSQKDKGVLESVRLLDVSHLCVYGNVQVTTQLIRELVDRGVPISYFSYGGWLIAMTTGSGGKNVDLRRRQYASAADDHISLAISREIVFNKVKNSRTILRRNHERPGTALNDMNRLAAAALTAPDKPSLLGIEGAAARTYFGAFGGMLKAGILFDFQGRNRRPPKDEVNALLSWLYSCLANDALAACYAVGFDPYLGFYHQPRHGRPALALDVMEEFRALIADSVCLQLVNTGEIKPNDFIRRGDAVALTWDGKKTATRAYERRMDALIQHPIFGYDVSYRRVIEIQIRLLSRYLQGELPRYPGFRTR